MKKTNSPYELSEAGQVAARHLVQLATELQGALSHLHLESANLYHGLAAQQLAILATELEYWRYAQAQSKNKPETETQP
jgi:hypothetical protein